MRDFAVLTPVVLLLLMLLLGRLERWVNASTPPTPPARSERRRWRPAPRPGRIRGSPQEGAGRRLTHRARSAARRRPAAAAPRASVPLPGTRRTLLRGRLRSRH